MRSWSRLAGLSAALVVIVALLGLLLPAGTSSRAPETSALLPPAVAWAAEGAAGIGDFMNVVHAPDGLRAQIQQAAESSAPIDAKTWQGIQSRARIMKYLTESILAKGTPEKGTKASWAKMVKEYSDLVDGLAKAADARDTRGIATAAGKISKGCQGCHKAHK